MICALVDDEDFEFLNKFIWSYEKKPHTSYASTQLEDRRVYMHQLILPCPEGCTPDHINGNGLDNQRSNLRIATYSQNSANRRLPKNKSSKYRGVTWSISNNQWMAQLKNKGHNIYLGYFSSEIDAARAYNRAALEKFGEFARINEFGEP